MKKSFCFAKLRQWSNWGKNVCVAVALAAILGLTNLSGQEGGSSVTPVTKQSFSENNLSVFADKAMTKLKTGIGATQIQRISDPFIRELATSLKDGKHDLKNRYKAYVAYEPVNILARRLKTSEYNKYENPTGILFEDGEQAVLWVEGMANEKPELKIHDFGPQGRREKSYPLKDGLNIIEVRNGGLGYISYYTKDFQNAPKIKAHILTGKVNGVFDSSVSKAEDWKGILSGTSCDVLDIVGQRVHLIYPV
ncbi:MAG: hypothetical protein LBV12_00850, partial [Puniceicoccales bacterium]|nr:hypothetical protein [Puniceicoccales bacterium]